MGDNQNRLQPSTLCVSMRLQERSIEEDIHLGERNGKRPLKCFVSAGVHLGILVYILHHTRSLSDSH